MKIPCSSLQDVVDTNVPGEYFPPLVVLVDSVAEDDHDLTTILARNKEWVEDKKALDPEYFGNL